jgi:hypothetical protein
MAIIRHSSLLSEHFDSKIFAGKFLSGSIQDDRSRADLSGEVALINHFI